MNRRDLGGALALLTAGAVLAGCTSGYGATSRQQYAPADGVIADSGNIRVLNALVVAEEGEDSGVVVMTVVNRGSRADELTEIATPAGSVTVTGPTELPPGGARRFGHDTETTATIGLLAAAPGEAIELTLSFAKARPVTLDTVVVAATGDYEGIVPSEPATPTATP